MMHEDVLEHLPIGILILNVEGNPVLSNSYAQQICRQLLKTQPELRPSGSSKFPQPIRRLCEAVLDSQELFPDRPIIIEDTIALAANTIHLRARWLDLEIEPYILVMLEAQNSIESTVEADQFDLTEQAEMWLRRRVGYA
jgi:hypothetical protein